MRKFADTLLILAVIMLMIFAGKLFLNVDMEQYKQLEASGPVTKEDISAIEVDLNDDYVLEDSSGKEDNGLSSDSGQAYLETTAPGTDNMDDGYEIYKEVQIRKAQTGKIEYESDTEKVQAAQEKIASGSLDPDLNYEDRGRIDRKQQFKAQEVNLTAYADSPVELLDWWESADKQFEKGVSVVVVDADTGKSFEAVRTYGSNHADAETLTAADTAVMKEIWGGEWSWERRAVTILINGKKLAASASGMPHAGLESTPEGESVENRSGDFGTGTNLDKIKGNDMDGHFDIHFLNSRTHGTDIIDEKHQQMVQKSFTSSR